MLEALAAAGYSQPTPIQSRLDSRALAGVDVLGQARTGTGKTAAFAIPILESLETGKKHGPQALVLVPTRELAVQVREEVVKLALGRKVHWWPSTAASRSAARSKNSTRRRSRRRHARPRARSSGRGTLDLRDLADRRARRSRPDARHRLPARHRKDSPPLPAVAADAAASAPRCRRRSNGWPSATCATRRSLNFSPKDISVETIEQFYFTVDPERKFELLVQLLEREQAAAGDHLLPHQARHRQDLPAAVEEVSRTSACIHGDLAQSARDRVMAGFRAGKVRSWWPPTSSAAAST